MDDLIKFSLSYTTLKLLGKTLYDNPFSAFSELIANSLDAGATKVYVFIDARNMHNAHIEVIDNGAGMTEEQVSNEYAKIGFNGRGDSTTKMGRKGIGKLSAFYLSNYYYVITKVCPGDTRYYLTNFSEIDESNENESPGLRRRNDADRFENRVLFDTFSCGTAIVLENVQFRGYGKEVFEAFANSLAELFVFEPHDTSDKDSNKQILFKVVSGDEEPGSYKPTERSIAFGNMTDIVVINDHALYEHLKKQKTTLSTSEYQDPDTSRAQVVSEHPEDSDVKALGLHGWIGIHHTRDYKKARANDIKFVRTSFFDPFKIRLYIRGKCAVFNLIPHLQSASQYTFSYLQGELFCDYLDDNDLPDIASSNRQSIDFNDDRVVKLLSVVNKIARKLSDDWSRRQTNDKKLAKKRQESAVKKVITDLNRDLTEQVGNALTEEDAQEFTRRFAASIKQSEEQVKFKTNYRVFLSHRRSEKFFADFIYHFLTEKKGFDPSWVFYTSKPGSPNESLEPLEAQIRNCITDTNSMVVFCVSGKEFKRSEYTLFEAGAAWATRQESVLELQFCNYEDVPQYLTSMKRKNTQVQDSSLDEGSYKDVVSLLNRLIRYLNHNILDDGEKKSLVQPESLPSPTQRQGNPLLDFMNQDVTKYWDTYVVQGFRDAQRHAQEGSAAEQEMDETIKSLKTILGDKQSASVTVQKSPLGRMVVLESNAKDKNND